MKINYQSETDKIIKSLTKKPSLLLHSCCAPCSTYVVLYLKEYFDLTVFFYNPNIEDEEEYSKRLDAQKQFLAQACPEIELIELYEKSGMFSDAVKGLEAEPEGGVRCDVCFALRISKTAELSKEKNFEYFCTTLSVSPHKNAQLINEIGSANAEKYGINWLPSDFKKRNGYVKSVELSKNFCLYRQNFCGCNFSKI